MLKQIGITGHSGFIGSHLYNTLGLYPQKYQRVLFDKSFFLNDDLMDAFISQCDVIVHLAGMNRHENGQTIYDTNIELSSRLAAAIKRTGKQPHVIFSSSLQEEKDNIYGKSKKDARNLLHTALSECGALFSGLIIPNVFGPFGKPYYNSVVATFCHQLTHGETPIIDKDAELRLIYVDELVREMMEVIDAQSIFESKYVTHSSVVTVSHILRLLERFRSDYLLRGIIPSLENKFELNLFNTFRSYINIRENFPSVFAKFSDARGTFSEIIRLNMGGQVSFSTTEPGATRGNHFHTRKIERFAVIRGEAVIQLRKVGTEEVIDLYLTGEQPAYVDMPIWYIHNIKNIGSEQLYTIFWINEFYNSDDTDTYFEAV